MLSTPFILNSADLQIASGTVEHIGDKQSSISIDLL